MILSPTGEAFIKRQEAPGGNPCLSAYRDSRVPPVVTIGWGTTHYPGGAPVQMGDTCTVPEAQAYFDHDIAPTIAAMNAAITITLTQNEFDAIVSLAYNEGAHAIANSTLVHLLNTGNLHGAADQFLAWNKVMGHGGLVVSQGLVNRRHQERAMFLS